ncbi:CusA/CzcA family heavy metal efflux RND transporter [Siphonobacter sp. BAB-5385]|uniref:CusA/CzcA family heavy metal efflux RND transporter n=1 Tax=Siphonobacter sp. BAB-5385 TaxID=1864822 RepID=UPI000B9E2D3E|nr:CusA/CzcA family heavy metal efflux RND transporter [Siphonobacter sp. BAB-5385]OZI08866.1 CusA/CzcA family heavy metal efflux RND transporter [Siphonobacter sp. BAB-5385]
MIDKIIAFSVRSPFTIGLLVLVMAIWGGYSLKTLPIDAVPDVTNQQVDVITNSPNLSSLEIERYITTPLEMAMANIPGLTEVRSYSKFGSSVVKLIFTDDTDIYWARQQVFERLTQVQAEIPEGAGTPILGPVSTGLGEIFQYVIRPKDLNNSPYTLTEIRTIQDWVVRRKLLGLPGVADVSGYGGYAKEYQAQIKTDRMRALGVTVDELYEALNKGNSNTGGAYIEKENKAFTIRGIGLAASLEDIANAVVKKNGSVPILVKDVADVEFGHALRFGALSNNGEGEVVGGSILMMKGANGNEVISRLKERFTEIQKELPPGLTIEPFLDRSKLVNAAIATVAKNLVEGAIIVMIVILIFLGNWRASLLAASVIPLAMLFAFIWMKEFGVVGNVMSLGAIDFGLLVDPAIIVVESAVLFLALRMSKFQGKKMTFADRQEVVISAAAEVKKSVIFGGLIILIVYVPILTLQGIEGKMFSPMAKTVAFAIIGALLLAVTYVPMMCAVMLRPPKSAHHDGFSEKIVQFFLKGLRPVVRAGLRVKWAVILFALAVLTAGIIGFGKIGGEFMPQIQEGDMVVDMDLPVGTPLTESIRQSQIFQAGIMKEFPDEVEGVVSKIGTSEVKVDPLPLESQEVYVELKDKKHWTKATNQQELAIKMNEYMSQFPGPLYAISQPIESRVNDMISGARTQVVVQLYGTDLDTLVKKTKQIIQIVRNVPGAVDVKGSKVFGLPQLNIHYDRQRMAVYGIKVEQVNRAIQMAFGGATAGVVYEDDRRFDVTLRLTGEDRTRPENIENLLINDQNNNPIPLRDIATISETIGPSEIVHENMKRVVNLGFNVRGRDLQSVVSDVIKQVDAKVKLPKGYEINYGGDFENFGRAKDRLSIVVPIALLVIFGLLYLTFRNFRDSFLIYAVVPLSAVGGVFSLLIRDMNFSISAGVGFIALFGVAVLNGILLVSHFNALGDEGIDDPNERVLKGIEERFRPVLMTSFVAALGFMPMALSTSVGSEVQKPLATVVIGGLLTATVLTLIVLPILYAMFAGKPKKGGLTGGVKAKAVPVTTTIVLLLATGLLAATAQITPNQAIPTKPEVGAVEDVRELTLDQALNLTRQHNPQTRLADLRIEREQVLLPATLNIEPPRIYTQAPSGENYRLGFFQTIQFPTVYSNQRRAQKQLVKVNQAEKNVTFNELSYQVRSVFNDILYYERVIQNFEKQDSLLSNFVRVTDVRLNVGQISRIERLNAESQYRENQIYLKQSRARLRGSRIQLWILTGLAPDSTRKVRGDFKRLNYASTISASDTSFSSNPRVAYFEENRRYNEKLLQVEKSRQLPGISLGYMNQGSRETPAVYRWEFGLTVPLWQWQYRSRQAGARKDIEIAQQQISLSGYELRGAYDKAASDYRTYRESLDYYETFALNQADEIVKAAQDSYRLGSIGYYNFLLNLQQAFQIRAEYLDVVRNYNNSIITIQYLKGE